MPEASLGGETAKAQ